MKTYEELRKDLHKAQWRLFWLVGDLIFILLALVLMLHYFSTEQPAAGWAVLACAMLIGDKKR